MNELPDDIRALLDKASAGAPPPPPGVEAQVLAKIGASTAMSAATATLAASLAKPIAVVVLAVAVGGGALLVANDARRNVEDMPPPPTPAAIPIVERWTPAPVVDFEEPMVTKAARNEPRADCLERCKGVAACLDRCRRSSPAELEGGESILLEHARDALSRGDGDVALRTLLEHRERFPDGQLVEERHALTVLAYAARGDKERAQAAARAFEREHPQSIFLETVRAAIAQ